jgi:hypothetical protein
MPKKVDYMIVSAKDFIKAKPSGEIDLEQSKKVLSEIATIAEPPADYEILLDIRQAYGNLTFIDVHGLVMEFGKHRAAFRNKIAVLSRDDRQFDNAQFMELCAKNRGFQIAAFINVEETIDWLTTCIKVEK